MRCSRAPACRASTGNAAAATAAAAAAAAGRGGSAVVASSASSQAGLVACKTRNSNQYEHPKKAPSNAHAVYLAPAPSCCASSGNAAAAAGRGGGADVTSRLPGGADGAQNKAHQQVRSRK
ncbi:hypothetical protein PF005_g21057 [Phytophthora fragariae]|uniref:Uncharacterized protein n=1 Tax=Phytophthora fragariae TaxID=53985 RepID=A0A6A3E3Z5_9STRA|nr:hypothetical protein PF003_g17691 [Phytophthora fragariae]KAE8928589.1 hypothetical protein PF009_g21279 [Phytophthora fragariae]KAE8960479.1 hypothetical protein PF011_g30078 [Phytophthora fragariae]KAE9061301.1 hypothetical protein PF007_g30308 [Phytophthora fragariae]KAE9076908.1 hypothetical protein PF010_g23713 [Phytophthora fragariae]